MSAYKCDDCGRFCNRLHDVWRRYPSPEIEREVCDTCWKARTGRKEPTQ